MRRYVPAATPDLEQLAQSGQCQGVLGFTVTPEWAAEVGEDDPEILEELLGQAAAEASPSSPAVVLVAETPSAADPITRANLQAIFVADSAGDLLWFGPQELAAALEAAR